MLPENHVSTSMLRQNQLSWHAMKNKARLHQILDIEKQCARVGFVYKDYHVNKVLKCNFVRNGFSLKLIN